MARFVHLNNGICRHYNGMFILLCASMAVTLIYLSFGTGDTFLLPSLKDFPLLPLSVSDHLLATGGARSRMEQNSTFPSLPNTTQAKTTPNSQIWFTLTNTSIQYRRNVNGVIRSVTHIEEEDYLQNSSSIFKLHSQAVNSFVPEVLVQASPCPQDGPFLLITMPSVHSHTVTRNAIRSTWGSIAHGSKWPRKSVSVDVKFVFFLGYHPEANMNNLKDESTIHGDIVIGNFLDSYRNLSVKIGFALHWTVSYCSSAQHLLKVDEDTFVNVPLLIDVLRNLSQQHERYVIGYQHATNQPPVVRHGEWMVEVEAYPLPYYPRYLYGHSYAISHEAIKDLLVAYQHFPLILVEDALFTGILAKVSGIVRLSSPRFASSFEQNKCYLYRDISVSQTCFRDIHDVYKLWSIIIQDKCQW